MGVYRGVYLAKRAPKDIVSGLIFAIKSSANLPAQPEGYSGDL